MGNPAGSDRRETASGHAETLGPGPSPGGSLADIALYLACAGFFFGLEQALAALGLYPLPELFSGGMTLILSLFVVVGLMRWRGQGWCELGLRRPARWWTIPAWAIAVIVVNIAAQLLIVAPLAALLDLPSPDLSRYDAITGNFPLYLLASGGAMFTGGFIEELIYRGFMVDRLARLFGGSRRGLWMAALLCGLPFGLIHFEWGLGGMFFTFFMGSILGVIYLMTGRNLWPLITGHAILDLVLMTQVYFGFLD